MNRKVIQVLVGLMMAACLSPVWAEEAVPKVDAGMKAVAATTEAVAEKADAAASKADAATTAVKEVKVDLEAAAKAYTGKCASCHGKDLKGSPTMAKMFKVDAAALNLVDEGTLAKTDEELTKITADGLNKMPAYKSKLKPEEIAAQVAYIRSLAPKAEPKAQ
ncbi:MAG: cytochrome c [Elusimicrobia bacterium]|nr:cytochrome c [Elusimicrobiota bacterium]